MSDNKYPRPEKNESPTDSLEIIELATQEIELLARAFDVIAEVCEERDEQEEDTAIDLPQYLLH